ncbi:M48 family metallopeptidase [Pseudoalteromonas ardens]|uniref:Metal-dependent hydrolase n=1 Tax=Pseudoalteromonas rubra TaxID=43658 RepID=A0A0L0ERZ4_9GAMM|nr:SprT family zinc-dependent metalloprotease [Pseudoalteromonas sp. R96]KNC67186.1 metal-dependent hydrolase [Pseudoalteromonas rubra]MDK1313938.1 SprT family zinc-dependent metalloprotease [Pseudoalteromonas sp. R96]
MILTIDDLVIPVKHSAQRKTMQLTVDRDSSLLLTAPPSATTEVLEGFVRSKLSWVYQKLAEKALMYKSIRPKRFVQGEGFLYLGRSYRLNLIEQPAVPLKLYHGRFHLAKSNQENARQLFISWYVEKGTAWLEAKADEFKSRLAVEFSSVKVRDLGYRWGSCGKNQTLYFHWKTILLPAKIAEYVVVHELSHLIEPSHSSEFWLCVERAMPDYKERKQWLAEHGMDVEGL